MGLELKVKFRLNHFCGHPDCVGSPGDVVETRKEVADMLAARGGGEIVPDPVVLEEPEEEESEHKKGGPRRHKPGLEHRFADGP